VEGNHSNYEKTYHSHPALGGRPGANFVHNRGGKTNTHDYHDDIDNDEEKHGADDLPGDDNDPLLDSLRVITNWKGARLGESLFF